MTTLTPEEALGIAARCWCTDETSDIVMDERLAKAFADALLAAVNGGSAQPK